MELNYHDPYKAVWLNKVEKWRVKGPGQRINDIQVFDNQNDACVAATIANTAYQEGKNNG